MRRKVGVLELLTAHRSRSVGERAFRMLALRQTAGIGPQAVSAWARQAGHEVSYAVYDGGRRPHRLLPDDLDLLFLSCHSTAAPLAYALARLYRRRGVRTVIGGPHASSFPEDCARFFDMVVTRCNRDLVRQIVADPAAADGVVACGSEPFDPPSVEERMPEIRRSCFVGGRPHLATVIPLLASTGCPYTCEFCIDWDRAYRSRTAEALHADLSFCARELPGVKLGFHDPNFAVRFDEVLGLLEERPPGRANRYLMQCSLSVLRNDRLDRLRRTGCCYIAPSVESWSGYSAKSGVAGRTGQEKLEAIIERFRVIRRYVPGLQVNFVYGLDVDAGSETMACTERFIRELPFLLPTATVAMPYGGTPLYENWIAQGRILTGLPFLFWYMPHLAAVPLGETPLQFYRRLIQIHEWMTGPETLRRRRRSGLPRRLRWIHNFRARSSRKKLARLRSIRQRMETDPCLRAFHEGESVPLPSFYSDRLWESLGRYGSLLTLDDLTPRHRLPSQSTASRPPLETLRNSSGSIGDGR